MNACTECRSEDGPRLVGSMNAPFVACGDCNAIGPKRKTAELAIKAWDALNPDGKPVVTPKATHAKVCATMREAKAKRNARPAPTSGFLLFKIKGEEKDIREKIEFEKGRWLK